MLTISMKLFLSIQVNQREKNGLDCETTLAAPTGR